MTFDATILQALVQMIQVGGAYGVVGLAIYCFAPAVIFCSGCLVVTGCLLTAFGFVKSRLDCERSKQSEGTEQ